jgi:transposase-like protein
MSYEELVRRLPNKEHAVEFLKEEVSFNRKCNECGRLRQSKQLQYYCPKCKDSVSLLAGTIFAKAHYPLQEGLLLTWLYSQGAVTSKSLQEKGLASTTVQRFLSKQQGRLLDWLSEQSVEENIEIDEAYLGSGKGRGNSRGVILAVEKKNNGLAIPQVLNNFTKKNCHAFIKENVQTNSVVLTDGWKGYNDLDQIMGKKYQHQRAGDYKDLPQVHSAINHLKRYLATYIRPVSEKYLPGYLAHWAFLYSHRGLTSEQKFKALLDLNMRGRVLS